MNVTRLAPALALTLALLAGCEAGPEDSTRDPSPVPTTSDAGFDAGRSEPREDSYYPDQGDPGIDVLHYGLDLTWDAGAKQLTGVADLVFRTPVADDQVQLDVSRALEVGAVTLDGAAVTYTQGEDLVIEGDFAADSQHTVRIEYAGSPKPVPAPTTRSDFTHIGWRTMPDGGVWAMQEPYGSFTWYPSNDQPADKALYDVTLRVPEEWAGVSNGVLRSDTVEDGRRVMVWHLSKPASTYLVTVAIGDYQRTQTTSASGVPIDFWTPRGDQRALTALKKAPAILDWIEKKLGPYPFDSLGYLIVPSQSGMETQTMITLGNTDYTRSPEVIQHETVHQWYGDLVSPTDWRDVWMNEGMTMFLQLVYQSERGGISIDEELSMIEPSERFGRAESGPPGRYDRGEFGTINIYYSPALMWNELRHELGDETFWEMVRAWPQVHAYGNATREEYYQWLADNYGVDRAFLDGWIMGVKTPR